MEAKQLMIGDWVEFRPQHGNPFYAQVEGTEAGAKTNKEWFHNTRVFPIALSPEILESNDFWRGSNNVWSWWNYDRTQSVDIYWNYDIAHVEAENNLQTHIETNITNLHELQHILCVADIDLEIKL